MSLKSLLKNALPENFLLKYHHAKSVAASVFFGNPSRDMIIIGITGTKGKSTAANFVWAALQAGGIKTGLVGTANIKIGSEEMMNKWHMTMPSPVVLQKLFQKMKNAGCKAVVLEVTSEGIKQHRQKNIDFDIGMFTNLSPEHLPSHNNSFEEYKNTKKKFFLELAEKKESKVFVNADSEYSEFFLDADISQKKTVSLEKNAKISGKIDYTAEIQEISQEKTRFSVIEKSAGESKSFEYEIFVGGTKNVENALLAVSLARDLGISPEKIQKGFNALEVIPGRMEKIEISHLSEKNKKFPENFSVFVDYAHEKLSMNFLMETGKSIQKNQEHQKNSKNKNSVSSRIIVLLGAEGGGRDPAKRAIMGKIVAQKADVVVVSNVDPYEDNPTEIAEDIAKAVEKNSDKKRGENIFVIEDRRQGIAKCLEIANAGEGDIVFITGKGSEQSIVIDGVSRPWDDRKVVREELEKIKAKS